MNRSIINYIIMFIVLMLAQVLVCNHIILFNVATPIVFIYLIICLPISLNVNWVLTIGFLSGLCIDIFSDTLGINCLACSVLAMLRKPVFSLYTPRENDNKDISPTATSLGFTVYAKYLFTLVFFFCVVAFCAEYLSFFNFGRVVAKILFSTILSSVVLFGIDSLIVNRREKRL